MILVIKNAKIEGLGHIEDIFKSRVIGYKYVLAQELDLETSEVEKFSGLIVLGGPQSVYESFKYPYLETEKKVIEKFISKDKPVLGICLGSQLIASTLGAKVYLGDRGSEIGWFKVQVTADGWKDSVFNKYAPEFWVFQWHSDTFDLPQGAKRIVTSESYINQGFTYGKSVYALQFHVEVTQQDVINWIEDYDFKDQKDRESMLKGFDLHGNDMIKICDDLIWKLFISKHS